MQGEKIGEGSGKVMSQRVLANPGGGPKVETTFQSKGTLLGVEQTETGTYYAVMRPDGSDVRMLTDNPWEDATPRWAPMRGSGR